ncbi:collagen alpha-1(III) chain-like [Cavia porcellus]|uniref:collagen alpha-1(III) chain-like n=1 Tax=Cavia porcellus TaxID=10141 RepID=UPI002FE0A2CD
MPRGPWRPPRRAEALRARRREWKPRRPAEEGPRDWAEPLKVGSAGQEKKKKSRGWRRKQGWTKSTRGGGRAGWGGGAAVCPGESRSSVRGGPGGVGARTSGAGGCPFDDVRSPSAAWPVPPRPSRPAPAYIAGAPHLSARTCPPAPVRAHLAARTCGPARGASCRAAASGPQARTPRRPGSLGAPGRTAWPSGLLRAAPALRRRRVRLLRSRRLTEAVDLC